MKKEIQNKGLQDLTDDTKLRSLITGIQGVFDTLKETEHPHTLLEKGKLYDAMKEQRDKCVKALKECKSLLEVQLHLPIGDVDPYEQERIAVKYAEEAIKLTE